MSHENHLKNRVAESAAALKKTADQVEYWTAELSRASSTADYLDALDRLEAHTRDYIGIHEQIASLENQLTTLHRNHLELIAADHLATRDRLLTERADLSDDDPRAAKLNRQILAAHRLVLKYEARSQQYAPQVRQ